MDLHKTAANYVNNMATMVGGLKALLLDEETIGMVSMVYTRTAILQKEVFLLDQLSNANRERMGHLKCIIFVRPTTQNAALICQELKDPKYGEYHIFWSNILTRGRLEQIAGGDEHEVVKQVHEFYCDFYCPYPSLFNFNLPTLKSLYNNSWDQQTFDRMSTGLLSVLLSMKRRPFLRYQTSSPLCQRLAADVKARLSEEMALFDFRRNDACLLLIMDRKEDPITPLLTQWTYEAQIQEYLGITNQRVPMPTKAGEAKPEGEDAEVVLSTEADPFWKKSRHINWGDLCLAIKQFVEEYKQKTEVTSKIETIEDMKKFMRDFPEFRKMGGNVSKHVRIVSEIGDQISKRKLMDVSMLEQEMACTEDHKIHGDELQALLANPNIAVDDALRLVMIYALRYEKHPQNRVGEFKQQLGGKAHLVDTLLAYGGARQRTCDLLNQEGIKVARMMTNLVKGMKDVKNVYTQHEPLLKQFLTQAVAGKLKEEQFPYQTGLAPPTRDWKPKEILVYIVGGATYEEAKAVEEFGAVPVLLGSNTMLNSKSFLEEMSYVTGA